MSARADLVGVDDFDRPPPEAYADEWDAAPVTSAGERVEQERVKQRPPASDAPPILMRSAAAIASDPQTTQWLHRPLLERRSLVLMYGAFGTLKSFVVLTLGLEVAQAGERVIYLHAEGRGLWKRLRAWAIRRAPDRKWGDVLGGLPFTAIERPLNLSADAVVTQLQAAIDAVPGPPPALIIVDTIARNSDGTVERSNEDAQVYLNRLDSGLRDRYGATVVLVHHVGHSQQDRHRGPYTLAASTDSLVRVERPDATKLEVVIHPGRSKDDPTGEPFTMVADVTEVDAEDDDGNPITSLALRRSEGATVATTTTAKPSGKNQERALIALREWARTHPDATHIASIEIRDLLRGHAINTKRRAEVTEYLSRAGVVTPAVGGFTLNREMLL